jgi:hypothetical protein
MIVRSGMLADNTSLLQQLQTIFKSTIIIITILYLQDVMAVVNR